MFTSPVGNFAPTPSIYKPTNFTFSTHDTGTITNPELAYDLSPSTFAALLSGLTANSDANTSYFGFSPQITKNATLKITVSASGISHAAACVVAVYDGSTLLTSWSNAAVTGTLSYSLSDGVNMSNLSVVASVESFKVAHPGVGTSLWIFDILITQ
jgi:hypothetical protein